MNFQLGTVVILNSIGNISKLLNSQRIRNRRYGYCTFHLFKELNRIKFIFKAETKCSFTNTFTANKSIIPSKSIDSNWPNIFRYIPVPQNSLYIPFSNIPIPVFTNAPLSIPNYNQHNNRAPYNINQNYHPQYHPQCQPKKYFAHPNQNSNVFNPEKTRPKNKPKPMSVLNRTRFNFRENFV